MDAIVAVAGTLLGTVLGAVGTYITQWRTQKRELDERNRELRRERYVEYLTCVHQIFSEIRSLSMALRESRLSNVDYLTALHGVSTEPAQVALEHLRLVAGQDIAAAAAGLWTHMRSEAVPRGSDLTRDGWRGWYRDYWSLRRRFLNAARRDLGLPELDWREAAAEWLGKDGAFRGPTSP